MMRGLHTNLPCEGHCTSRGRFREPFSGFTHLLVLNAASGLRSLSRPVVRATMASEAIGTT